MQTKAFFAAPPSLLICWARTIQSAMADNNVAAQEDSLENLQEALAKYKRANKAQKKKIGGSSMQFKCCIC